MRERSLKILDDLLASTSSRVQRSEELLKRSIDEVETSWFMHVPSCFNDSLDIKLTDRVKSGERQSVLTQGVSFSFKAGDVIYDTAEGYLVWSEALKSISLAIQVRSAISASISDSGGANLLGSVTFSILAPNDDKTRLKSIGEHTLSQVDFVRFLIEGPSGPLSEIIPQAHAS